MNPRRYKIFSIDGFTKNFKFMCSGILCCVYGLINLCSWLFLRLIICGLVQVLFLSIVVTSTFLNSHFPVTTLILHPFSGAYHNKFPVAGVPSD